MSAGTGAGNSFHDEITALHHAGKVKGWLLETHLGSVNSHSGMQP